jgi:pre-mRNA-splicing factor SYF1
LFEEALLECPQSLATPIWLLYAKFEEEFGILKLASAIYKRAADHVGNEDIVYVWLSASDRLFGAVETRNVYDYAIRKFDGELKLEWCRNYASYETKLLEFDRARSIYLYAAEFADFGKNGGFWEEFERFEQSHGSKETYAEMLSQRNIARARTNVEMEIGDEEQELVDVEATRRVMEQGQKIPETIYDAGSFTVMERFARKRRT